MKYLINFLKGALIGIANLIPGVSGGTMAVSLGIYEELIHSIGNLFKNFLKRLKFLLPIFIGAFVGIVAFSKIIKFLLENFETPTKFGFIGLIIGGLPLMLQKSNKNGFKPSYIIPFIITFSVGICLFLLQLFGAASSEIVMEGLSFGNVILLIIYGFIVGGSMIIPGISGSFILMLMGGYFFILSLVAEITKLSNVLMLIPFGIGAVLGVLVCSKIIDMLIKKFYGYTYYAIIGFVIGSLPVIFPNLTFDFSIIINILILVIGFLISFIFSKYTNKPEAAGDNS